jgi:hypothetical protein
VKYNDLKTTWKVIETPKGPFRFPPVAQNIGFGCRNRHGPARTAGTPEVDR